VGWHPEAAHRHTFSLEKKQGCPVCDQQALEVVLDKTWTLQRLIDYLTERPDMCAEPGCYLH
jgi:hypothetical protein